MIAWVCFVERRREEDRGIEKEGGGSMDRGGRFSFLKKMPYL
jgi:hypothetical protein